MTTLDHTRVVGPDMRPGRLVKGGQIELHIRPLAAGQQWSDWGPQRVLGRPGPPPGGSDPGYPQHDRSAP